MVRDARGALSRFVIEGYLIRRIVFISRVFLFDSNIHCFLLLLLLFAFRSRNRKSTEGRSQALQRIVAQAHLRALKVQAPQVQVHQFWASVPALLVPLGALSSQQYPWCPYDFLPPFRSVVSLDLLVVLHGVAGTQRLNSSATRKLKQASTDDCFDDIVLFVRGLAPAAS